jgi:hypothetical protein
MLNTQLIGCLFLADPEAGAVSSSIKEHDMFDIRHRVGITAPAGRVYHALATTDGLSGWWTRDVTGYRSRGRSSSSTSATRSLPP